MAQIPADGMAAQLRSCFDFINCRIEMYSRGIFAWLPRSIAGYVTKQPGEYDRKDTQDGSGKRQLLRMMNTGLHAILLQICN